VTAGPAGRTEPAAWTSTPDTGGSGQFSVSRDVLRSVAGRMRADVADLDAAVQRIRGAGSSLGSLSGWSTGNAFGGNVTNSCTGFGQLGAHTSDTQNSAAKALIDAAATYDDAESANSQAVKGIHSALNSSAGSVPTASGI
jgi:hypothetical protein